MASGPMRQSIPLADTVRAMAGDASGLVKELERERKKLERHVYSGCFDLIANR